MSSRQMALSGILSALAAAFLTAGGMLGIATYCAPILAMATLLPVLEECGPKAAGAAWGAVSLLGLLLSPDRGWAPGFCACWQNWGLAAGCSFCCTASCCG